jgi:hypothetical protein
MGYILPTMEKDVQALKDDSFHMINISLNVGLVKTEEAGLTEG